MNNQEPIQETLPGVARMLYPPPGVDRATWHWCKRCEDTGLVRETRTFRTKHGAYETTSVSRCRCRAGASRSPSIGVCSDEFWDAGPTTSEEPTPCPTTPEN